MRFALQEGCCPYCSSTSVPLTDTHIAILPTEAIERPSGGKKLEHQCKDNVFWKLFRLLREYK